MKPTLSIIVPMINEEKVLPALLADIKFCQLKLNFSIECVFCDGGSTDRSVALCKAAGFPVVPAERGRGQQLDAGARKSRGDVLLFLHADSRLLPHHCELAVESVQNSGTLAGGFTLKFDDRHPILKLAEWINLLRFRCTKVLYGDHGLFIRRDKYNMVGGFSPLALFEDIDFSKRVRKLGRVVMTPFPLTTSARRFRAGGVLPTYLKMACLHVLYWFRVSPEKLASLYARRHVA